MSTATEALAWTATSASLPDAELTVMAWVECGDGTTDWCSAWWDGEAWNDCASGGLIAGTVTHWATPNGPLAC